METSRPKTGPSTIESALPIDIALALEIRKAERDGKSVTVDELVERAKRAGIGDRDSVVASVKNLAKNGILHSDVDLSAADCRLHIANEDKAWLDFLNDMLR